VTLTRKLTIASILLLSLALAACGGGEQEASSAVLTQAAQIYSDSLTQTAAVAPPTATATIAAPTATNTIAPPTFTPTVTGTPPTSTPLPPTPTQGAGGNTGGGGNNSGTGCLRAELTYETIPDGTRIEITENFQKRWVLKNVGTCTWNQDFSLSFVQGELFGTKAAQAFADFTDLVEIPPGERIDITVPMRAPDTEGTYKGYWMLRSADGILFGLGPDGRAWFWVEIIAED
jgi:hypothetical protein